MDDSTGLANKLYLNDYYGEYCVREISIFNRKKRTEIANIITDTT